MVIKDEICFSKSVGPYISGGSADLKLGQHAGCTVAVKKMRVAMSDDFERVGRVRTIFSQSGGDVDTTFQRFCKELVLWKFISHPNVLKLVGVLDGIAEGDFVTVSEWMTHGNIIEYIRKNATNRLELVCVSKLRRATVSY